MLFLTSGDESYGGSLAGTLPCLITMDSPDSPLVWHLLTSWWPAWQLSLFDSHTCTCRQTLVGPEYGIECVASSGSSDRVGAEKHEISVAAFDSHLLLQSWWGHGPLSPPRSATGCGGTMYNVHSNRMSNARSAHGPYNLTHLPCFSLSVVHCH